MIWMMVAVGSLSLTTIGLATALIVVTGREPEPFPILVEQEEATPEQLEKEHARRLAARYSMRPSYRTGELRFADTQPLPKINK